MISHSEINSYNEGKGLCIIINQKLFYADPNIPNSIELEERSWTDEDRNKLRETFTSFGAECIVFNDLTREELVDRLEEAQQKANSPQYSWLTIWILTHRRRLHGIDQVLGCNGVGVDISKIINSFTDIKICPNLLGKPKLFFYEASPQPATLTQISSTEHPPATCCGSDYMVTSFSPQTINSRGNIFIQRFCSLLSSQGEESDLTYVLGQAQPMEVNNTTNKRIVLRQVIRECSESSIDNDINYSNCGTDITNYLSTASMLPIEPATEECYARGPGLCIIINQELFYADSNIPQATVVDERQATEKDKEKLKSIFSCFGAKVLTFEDLTREELKDKLEDAAVTADDPEYCWVALCILSHGGDLGGGVHGVYGCNGVGLPTEKIVNIFTAAPKRKTLSNKPKLFFFQACKPTNGGFEMIKGTDYMIAGFVPWRSPFSGSFFISHLCSVLEELGSNELLERILQIVGNKVYYNCLDKVSPSEREGNRCKPDIVWKLNKKFKFARTNE